MLNFMLHVRGRRSDYERWETKHKLPGWGWADVEPLYKRMESYRGPGADAGSRGREGPIVAHRMEQFPELMGPWLDAARETGLGVTEDYNGAQEEGMSRMQVNIHDGKRQSTYQTYLEAAKSRPNLHVLTDAHVAKVAKRLWTAIFPQPSLHFKVLLEGKTAAGVEFEHDGALHAAKTASTGEVILSGGAIGSPHILLLSGIGPKEQLKEHGVDAIWMATDSDSQLITVSDPTCSRFSASWQEPSRPSPGPRVLQGRNLTMSLSPAFLY